MTKFRAAQHNIRRDNVQRITTNRMADVLFRKDNPLHDQRQCLYVC